MYVSLDYNHRLSYSYLIKPFLEFIKKADRSKLQGKTLAIEFSPFKVTDEYMYPDLIGVRYKMEYLMEEGKEYPIGISLEWTTPDGIEEQREPDKAKYFRFILRKRKESGETITPEEERLAVYPDYNETQTDTKTEDFAKGQLSDIFYLWEIEKRKKTPKRGRPKKTK